MKGAGLFITQDAHKNKWLVHFKGFNLTLEMF
jgi:hypothetical protein